MPPAKRIATFDNDGTLWCEKPMYIQLVHGMRAISKTAAAKPDVRNRQPFKAVYEKDMTWLSKTAEDYAKGDPTGFFTIASGITEAFADITVDEFEADAREFLTSAQHDRFKVPYKQLTYKPMVELIKYLKKNEFDVWITSAGGRDFMRAVSEEIYGLSPSKIIGSSVTFRYADDEKGIAQLLRNKDLEQPIDDGPGKPPHIHRATGRRPIFAAGNADGDIHMLKYAKGQRGLSLALLVHHDDADREYIYDSGAERALQLAPSSGWVVVSMRNDFKRVF
jgi:phosphoglycolate phosphatase-like HAD superfamily hydrolase